MGILRHQPIRRQIIAATCLLLLPLTAATIWATTQTQHERETELQQQAVSVANTAAEYLDQYLNGLDSMASALARNTLVVVPRRGEPDHLFADVLRGEPLLLNILLTDPTGEVTNSAVQAPPAPLQRGGPGQSPRRPSIAAETAKDVQRVAASGKPVVSQLSIDPLSGKPTVMLMYPVKNADLNASQVLAVGIHLEGLQTLLATIPLPEGSVVTLTDAASRVLARSHDARRYIGTAVNPQPVPPQRVATTLVFVGPDGVARYYGNAIVARGPWLLSVGIPTSLVADRLAGLRRRNLTILVSAIASALLLALWLSGQLSRDLNSLRSAAQRIAEGDLSPPREMHVPNLELAELQDAFVTMAANLRTMRDTLDRQVAQERKMREMLQSLQRQVVRQERLTAVGLLVSGVAHELNNPLQAILGTLELLERDSTLTDQVREEIAFAKTQSGRAREIIRNLSRFSSQQSGPPAPVDLRDVIAEVVQLRRRDLDLASIALELDAISTRKVLANFTELQQVLLNFVINAQQSIELTGRGKGRILIRLLDVGQTVRLEVWDDGPGVSPEDEPKLFQPFFTTKPVGKGTGLGLSVSYGIVDSYDGTIGYRTNEWGGATFFFELSPPDALLDAAPDSHAGRQ